MERINEYVQNNKKVVILAGDKDNTTKVLRALNNAGEIETNDNLNENKIKPAISKAKASSDKTNLTSIRRFKGNQVVYADSLDKH